MKISLGQKIEAKAKYLTEKNAEKPRIRMTMKSRTNTDLKNVSKFIYTQNSNPRHYSRVKNIVNWYFSITHGC